MGLAYLREDNPRSFRHQFSFPVFEVRGWNSDWRCPQKHVAQIFFWISLHPHTHKKKRKTSPINIPYLGSKKKGYSKHIQTLRIYHHPSPSHKTPQKTHAFIPLMCFLDVGFFVGHQNWWRHIHKASRGELGHQRPSHGWLVQFFHVGPGNFPWGFCGYRWFLGWGIWRIIPFSKWFVTSNCKPWKGHLEGVQSNPT